jgi:hypothetical protein
MSTPEPVVRDMARKLLLSVPEATTPAVLKILNKFPGLPDNTTTIVDNVRDGLREEWAGMSGLGLAKLKEEWCVRFLLTARDQGEQPSYVQINAACQEIFGSGINNSKIKKMKDRAAEEYDTAERQEPSLLGIPEPEKAPEPPVDVSARISSAQRTFDSLGSSHQRDLISWVEKATNGKVVLSVPPRKLRRNISGYKNNHEGFTALCLLAYPETTADAVSRCYGVFAQQQIDMAAVTAVMDAMTPAPEPGDNTPSPAESPEITDLLFRLDTRLGRIEARMSSQAREPAPTPELPASLNQKLNAILSRVHGLEAPPDNTDLLAHIDEGVVAANLKLATFDQSLQSNSNLISNLDQSVRENNSRLTAIQRRLSDLDTNLGLVDTFLGRLERLENTLLEAIDDGFEQAQQADVDLKPVLEAVNALRRETDIANMSEQVSALRSEIATVLGGLSSLRSEIANIQQAAPAEAAPRAARELTITDLVRKGHSIEVIPRKRE